MSDRDILTGQRQESWQWQVLDLDGNVQDTLDGVTDGATLEWSTAATIKGGGSLTYKGQPVDWSKIMLQPVYSVTSRAGSMSWPVGVFIPSTPGASWDDSGSSIEVELYDKLQILDQDKVDATYTVAAGQVVTTAIGKIVKGAAPGDLSIDDSEDRLSSAMVWSAGTSRLRIVNDLLDSINYFSLWVDGHGVFHGDHYQAPSARGITWDFRDDQESIYTPEFEHDQDLFSIPNKVIEIAQPADDDSDSLVSVATNEDPDSPTSYQARGRWVVQVDDDADAASQSALDKIAQRRLAELSDTSSTVQIKHAIVPLTLNDAVTFRRNPAGLDMRGTVQSFSIDTTVGGLVTTKIKEVTT